jgi:hypothetical protein
MRQLTCGFVPEYELFRTQNQPFFHSALARTVEGSCDEVEVIALRAPRLCEHLKVGLLISLLLHGLRPVVGFVSSLHRGTVMRIVLTEQYSFKIIPSHFDKWGIDS